MRYANDPQFDILYNGTMYYITEVHPVQTQWAAMWVGPLGDRSRRLAGHASSSAASPTSAAENELPGPNSRISLGTWYGEDGRMLDVVGHFVDGGRGLHCAIGGQPFELYLHRCAPVPRGAVAGGITCPSAS